MPPWRDKLGTGCMVAGPPLNPRAGNTGAAMWAAVGASPLLPGAAARRRATAATVHSHMLPQTHGALQAA